MKKFNRNHANAGDDRFYLDDYRADINSIETEVREVLTDLGELPFIIEGLEVEIPDPTGSEVRVQPGSARDPYGYKIVVPTTQSLQYSEAGYILLRYKEEEGDTRKAYTTGVEWPTRRWGSFELSIEASKADDAVVLGYVQRINGNLVLDTTERTKGSWAHRHDEGAVDTPTITEITTGVESDIPGGDTIEDYDRRAYVKVKWSAVAGATRYEVIWVPRSDDTDLWDYRMEFSAAFGTSPPRTEYTIRGLRIGEKGRVWLRAWRYMEHSTWAISNVITAGDIPLPDTPEIQLISYPRGVLLTITHGANTVGCEVFVSTDGWPSSNDLFYRGPARKIVIPCLGTDDVFVKVRAYNAAGKYSDFVQATTAPSLLPIEEDFSNLKARVDAVIDSDGNLNVPKVNKAILEGGALWGKRVEGITSSTPGEETAVAHGLGRTPQFVAITARGNYVVYESKPPDDTYIYVKSDTANAEFVAYVN